MASIVATAIGRIAFELRPDVLQAMREALVLDNNPYSRRALDMLIENAQIAATDRVPLCQDTGSVWVLLEVGPTETGTPSIASNIFSQVDAAVSWLWRENRLRNSMLTDALLDRSNTGGNTPAFCELAFNPDVTGIRLSVMLKGGGSDNASRTAMLNPGDGWPAIRQFVVSSVAEKAANACPPLIIGVGVGSSFDKVAGFAKKALLKNIDQESDQPEIRIYEAELLEAINQLDVGAGAMGGITTALAVRLITAPCHMASLPVAVNIGCSAMRSVSYELVGEW